MTADGAEAPPATAAPAPAAARRALAPPHARIALPSLPVLTATQKMLLVHTASVRRHKVLLSCALRLLCTLVVAVVLPLRAPWLADMLPRLGLLGRPVATLVSAIHEEVLLLATASLLMPLPLKHHLWVQAFGLHTALARVPSISQLHAALMGHHGECSSFVSAARWVVQAVVPGSLLAMAGPAVEAHCCWMQHTWGALVIGLVLPTAIAAARVQHAAARAAEQRAKQLSLDPHHHTASWIDSHSHTSSQADTFGTGRSVGTSSGRGSGRGSSAPSWPTTPLSPANTMHSGPSSSIPAGFATASDLCSTDSGSGPDGWSSSRADSEQMQQRMLMAQLAALHPPTAPLRAYVATWLLLLIPASTAVWAAVEVAAVGLA